MTSSHGRWVWRKSSFSEGGNNACVEIGHWRKSSFSQGANNSDCVELSSAGAVRDSKNPAGPPLRVDLPTLLVSVKSDEFRAS